MRFNPSHYKQRQLWAALRKLKDEDLFPVAVLREMAGCSQSVFYAYIHSDFEEAEVMPGHQLAALMEGLARDYGNYRLFQLMLPDRARITVDQVTPQPNGLADEVQDAALATGELEAARRADDAETVDEVADRYQGLSLRCRSEAAQIRALRERKPRRAS